MDETTLPIARSFKETSIDIFPDHAVYRVLHVTVEQRIALEQICLIWI